MILMSKIGRNEQCPCGSGKKYKKCCICKMEDTNEVHPQYFQLKGKNAEEVVHELAQKTFFTDWCFLNPKLPGGKELCDLLVVFDDIAIVWQIKNLKLDEDGHYKDKEKEKNLSQLSGAKRSLFDLKVPIELENERRRRKEKFDPSEIKEVYYISALIGDGEWSYSPTEEYKGLFVNVLPGQAMEVLLSELNTITDFTKYLRDKKNFFDTKSTGVIIDGGEEDLMAYYLMNDKSFQQNNEADMLWLAGGFWEDFSKSEKYLSKKEADKISYGWDNLIDRAHEGSEKYEKVARELARPDRFRRRMLSKAFYDAYKTSHENNEYTLYRRVVPEEDVTYCFLFMDAEGDRQDRIAMLTAFCMVARIKFNKQRVIGIATGSKIRKISAYDYCVMDIPEVTEKFKNDVEKVQKDLNIMVNPTQVAVNEDEYPIQND